MIELPRTPKIRRGSSLRKLSKSVLHGMEIADCIRRGITTIGRDHNPKNDVEKAEIVKRKITSAELCLGVRCVRAFCSRSSFPGVMLSSIFGSVWTTVLVLNKFATLQVIFPGEFMSFVICWVLFLLDQICGQHAAPCSWFALHPET